MAANMSTIMDVDSPVSLKRSNSAPMINELNSGMNTAAAGSSVPSALALRLVCEPYNCYCFFTFSQYT